MEGSRLVKNAEEEENSINWMDVKLFRELGFLQEVNRLFLHPLGLSLLTRIDDSGSESIAGIGDYRNDPEGLYFGLSVCDADTVSNFRYNALQVRKLLDSKKELRSKMFGSEVEPIPLEGKK